MNLTRRELLAILTSAGTISAPGLLEPALGWAQPPQVTTGWDAVPHILARIVAPVFPSRDFQVSSYGAKPDGSTDCTGAFKRAIDACNAAGGGRVIVPAGRYLTGAI